jgi:hypothetical protein
MPQICFLPACCQKPRTRQECGAAIVRRRLLGHPYSRLFISMPGGSHAHAFAHCFHAPLRPEECGRGWPRSRRSPTAGVPRRPCEGLDLPRHRRRHQAKGDRLLARRHDQALARGHRRHSGVPQSDPRLARGIRQQLCHLREAHRLSRLTEVQRHRDRRRAAVHASWPRARGRNGRRMETEKPTCSPPRRIR